MDKRLNKIMKQSKENNTTASGKITASRKRLQQRGAEEYIDSLGEAYTPSEAKDKIIKDTGEENPGRIQVGEGFNMNRLRESQKQAKVIEESEDLQMRGEILDSDGEKTALGESIAEKLEVMNKEKEKFEIHESAKNNAINTLWNISRKNHDVIENSYAAFNTEFGLYASIPMLCKGEDCVYATLYPELHGTEVAPGERCPVEVALIMSRYDQYKDDLMIDPEDTVDMSILRDVIDYDIQIVRAENKVATEGDFVKDVTVGISQTGQEIIQEQITQASEYKQRVQDARNKALNLLNSTRKDKAGQKLTLQMDPSTYTKELLEKANAEIIDIAFEEVDEKEPKSIFDGLEIIEDEPYMQRIKGDDKE